MTPGTENKVSVITPFKKKVDTIKFIMYNING